MMKVSLCLLAVGILGLVLTTGREEVRLSDYMPWIYNFYDVIAQGTCITRTNETALLWAVRRSCNGTKTCTELCIANGLACLYSFHMYKNPKILSDSVSKKTEDDVFGLQTHVYELDQGCSWPAGHCGPNYCCCEGLSNTEYNSN